MKMADIHVKITADVSEFVYAMQTATASFTRLDRAMWPTLPLWRRIWLTYRRRGW